MKLKTSTIVAIGIGSAVFLVLNRFVSIPTGIPNTNLSTAYPFLAFMAALFGPIAGALIGLIGHALTDMLFYGGIWWSWVIGSVVAGIIFGLAAFRLRVENGEFSLNDIITFNVIQLIGNGIAWGLVAPFFDIVIYSEPKNKVFTQGLVAGISNAAAVAILGTLFLYIYSKSRTRSGSLTKED